MCNAEFSHLNAADQAVTPKTFSGPAELVHEKSKHGAAATCWMPGDSKQMPQNKICQLLADRIHHLIMAEAENYPFHVYITLPVHPEGLLNEGAVITQVHWTMQSLVFGSHSLLNRIRRSLYAKTLPHMSKEWMAAFDDDNHDYADHIPVTACDKYVTLLNLRNWANLGTESKPNYVTEQVYIHSKMMIVDDRFALVGSANINDRSLMGGRDSELAVLVMDTKVDKVDLCGDGKKRPVRGFARQLRIDVWNKIFGITAGKRAATELAEAVLKPGSPKSWEKIREVAAKNTELYEAAFDFIPRNKDSEGGINKKTKEIFSASIWPRWHAPIDNEHPWTQSGPMPFEEEFWSTPQFTPYKANDLKEVKGFITLLPIEWTQSENNNIGYHMGVVSEREKFKSEKSVQMAAINQQDAKG